MNFIQPSIDPVIFSYYFIEIRWYSLSYILGLLLGLIVIKKLNKNKGDLINFSKIEIYEDLPTVFGNKEKFYILYKDLKDIEFPIEKMKSFFYFESGRWDLVTQENKTIKLPVGDYLPSLNNYMMSINDKSFNEYKIYDYRIKDQLILN